MSYKSIVAPQPEGWNLTINKDFKYIDEDTESECSEYSFIDDFVPPPQKKKNFRSVITKEEFLPE